MLKCFLNATVRAILMLFFMYCSFSSIWRTFTTSTEFWSDAHKKYLTLLREGQIQRLKRKKTIAYWF